MHDLAAELERIRDGALPRDLESQTLDFKTVGRSLDAALTDLAEAAACFANAEGGTLVVGVKDAQAGMDAFVDTPLDPARTVRRIHELTDPPLLVNVRPLSFHGRSLTIIDVPISPEIHLVRGVARERVGDSCQPMNAARIMAVLLDRRGDDWSAGSSGIPVDDASPSAIESVRALLRQSGGSERQAWASLPWPDICRRLGASTDDCLTNGGAMMFTDRSRAHIHYTRRVPTSGLLAANEQLAGTGLRALQRSLELIDGQTARTAIVLPTGQQLLIQDLPDGAVREAMVNAFMHRDYRTQAPIQIEHSAGTLRVTSPGGFAPGVSTTNVLTVSSRSRNLSLVNLMRALGLGEAAGVGVDRMYSAMTSIGHKPPRFDSDGTSVEIVLQGGPPNEPITRFVASLPEPHRDDPDTLLTLTALLTRRTTTAARMAPLMQKSEAEAERILNQLSAPGSPLLERTADTARSASGEYRLVGTAIRDLGPAIAYRTRSGADTDRKIVEIVRGTGSITGRVVQSVFDIRPQSASRILSDLVDRQILEKTSAASRGPSVTYGPGPKFPSRATLRGASDSSDHPTLDL